MRRRRRRRRRRRLSFSADGQKTNKTQTNKHKTKQTNNNTAFFMKRTNVFVQRNCLCLLFSAMAAFSSEVSSLIRFTRILRRRQTADKQTKTERLHFVVVVIIVVAAVVVIIIVVVDGGGDGSTSKTSLQHKCH
jgi:hypothetical protein